MDIWSILVLEPTRDVSAIKRAYAGKTRVCHPEDDPEGFMRLREAYQAALDYAQEESVATSGQGEPDAEQERDSEAQENNGWSLPDEPEDGPNPFEDSEAIRQFLELYTGKQRKDGKRWLDYFTSAAFLDAAREPKFTRLLMEHVVRLEGEYPVNREFLNWLCVAWVNEDRCDYYLQRVIDFYEAHPAAPCARRIIDRAKEMIKVRENAARLQEDQNAAAEDAMTLTNRAFFRH